MKKILFILGFCGLAGAADGQEVKDVKGNVLAYITRSTISDKNQNTLCVFQIDGRIVDKMGNTIGYMEGFRERYDYLDKDRKLKASYYFEDGGIKNEQGQRVGSIPMATGPIIKAGNVIATMDNVEPMWAAAYFFMFRYQEKQ